MKYALISITTSKVLAVNDQRSTLEALIDEEKDQKLQDDLAIIEVEG